MALGLGRGAWDGAAAADLAFPAPRVCPGSREDGDRSLRRAGQGRRGPCPFQRGRWRGDAVSTAGDRGAGRTRGAPGPLTSRASRAAAAQPAQSLRPPAPQGSTWTARPPPRAARGPSPRWRPALPAPALTTCGPRLGHGPGGQAPAAFARSLAAPSPVPAAHASAASGLRAPRPAPPPRSPPQPPPPQPPPPRRSLRSLKAPSGGRAYAPALPGACLTEEGAARRPAGPRSAGGPRPPLNTLRSERTRRGDEHCGPSGDGHTDLESGAKSRRTLGTRDTSGAKPRQEKGEEFGANYFPGTW